MNKLTLYGKLIVYLFLTLIMVIIAYCNGWIK
jgi:hypothetical protein